MTRHGSMNHIFRLIWSPVLGAWVAVAEVSRGRGKGSGRAAAALLTLTCALAQGAPTGAQVVKGAGNVTQSGAVTTIVQDTARLELNWQSFNVGAQETVNFRQPGSSAVAVNRIFDTAGSQILGRINANGQVYLINPNGILFGRGAQVDVGSLVASTLDLHDAGPGTQRFSGDGNGSVRNEGSIRAADGGFVALLGKQVANQGVIAAHMGTVALGAGSAVTLSFNGNSLLRMQVDQSTLNNLADNGGLLKADGGMVLMHAGARDALLASVVNNTGVIEARTAQYHEGTITLLGGMSAGSTIVSGTLDASAPAGGNGGKIDTSAAHVKVADGARVTTAASGGRFGSWLIDPQDFNVQAGGDISGSALSAALDNTPVQLLSSGGGSAGSGNVNVNEAVSWSAGTTLTLTASNDVNINAPLTASGNAAALVIEPNTANGAEAASGSGAFKLGAAGVVTLSGAAPGLSIAGVNYTVINSLGIEGDTGATLQGMAHAANLAGNFALGTDLDALASNAWNGGAGFTPIGNGGAGYAGSFNGLGHTISNLRINVGGNDYGGLFGQADASAVISNVKLSDFSVNGNAYIGALVGRNLGLVDNSQVEGLTTGATYLGMLVGLNDGVIGSSSASGTIIGSNRVGGLVGVNTGTIADSHSAAQLIGQSGQDNYGGLVGANFGTVTRSYASGDVQTGGQLAGGLVGYNNNAIIDSYATGSVSGYFHLGGLVGYQESGNNVTNSHYDLAASVNGTPNGLPTLGGLYSAQFQDWLSHGKSLDIANYSASLPGAAGAYSVGSAQGLKDLLGFAGQAGYTFTMSADIDLAATPNISVPYLAADFDGAGHTIRNLSMTGYNQSTVGLFGRTAPGAVISRLGLVDVMVSTNEGGRVGALVGWNKGTIDSSYVNGELRSGSTSGLMAGFNEGTISASHSAGLVVASNRIGGLVGINNGTIDSSYSVATVDTRYGQDLHGGLVGENGGTISNSYAAGLMLYDFLNNTGALVGYDHNVVGTSYWNSDVNPGLAGVGGGNGVGAVALTGAQMRDKANFTGFNFTATPGLTGNNWVIVDGAGTLNNAGGALGATSPMLASEYSTGLFNGHQVQLMAMAPGAAYTLERDVSMAGTGILGDVWGSAGFAPITTLTGSLDGQGHTLANLAINRPTLSPVGLFSNIGGGASVQKIGFVDASVVGQNSVGILVGENFGTVSQSYAGGSVSGAEMVGGLMGRNSGVLTDSYASASVAASDNYGGGLAGVNLGAVSGSYATGSVANGVGMQYGGLLGYNNNAVSTSYWDINSSGQATSFGGTGLSSGQMLDRANSSGFDFSTVWAQYDGHTAPLLRTFLKPFTVTADNAIKTYDANAFSGGIGVTLSGPFDAHVLGFPTYAGNAQGAVNAGTYAITPSGLYSDQQGYLFNFVSGTLTVDPATLTVGGVNKVYDSTNVAGLSLIGLFGNDQVSPVAASSVFDDKNVGTGKSITTSAVTLAGSEAGNYLVTQPVGLSADVGQAAITVSGVSADNKVYDGNAVAVVNAAASNLQGLFANDDVTISTTGVFDDRNVGVGKTVSLSSSYGGADLGNYAITDQASASATISARALTVSGVTAGDKVYDGATLAAVNSAAATLTGLVSGDDVSIAATGEFDDKNVGIGKTVTLSSSYGGADLGNYAITGQASTTASISAKALGVSGITASGKIYDGGVNTTVSSAAAALSGLVGGDDVSVAATGVFDNKNMGTGKTVTLSSSYGGVDLGNYAITGQASTTASISAKALGVSGITASGKVYDGGVAAAVSSASASLSGLVGGDDVSVAATGVFDNKNVGTGKTVTLSSSYGGVDLGNYAITGQASTTASISAKALSVSGITASGKVYDGGVNAAVSSAAASLSGLVGGDDVSVAASGVFDNKNVSVGKTITLSSSYGGVDLGNYAITGQASTTASISAKALSVSGISASGKLYDGGTAAAVNSASASLSGLVGGDDVSVAASGVFDNKNVGVGKTVTLSSSYGGVDLGNYAITGQTTTTASISAKALSVSGITASGKVYDGGIAAAVSSAAASLSGLVGGDDVSVAATGVFDNKNVGIDKTVTLSSSYDGVDLGNYAITGQASTTASVSAKALSVSGITASGKVYDGGVNAAVSNAAASLSGLVGGDDVSVAASGVFDNKNVGVGKTVTLSSSYGGVDLGNYAITSQAATTASISAKALNVSGITASGKVYDGGVSATISSAAASLSGLVGGDDVNVAASGVFDNKNVGVGKTVTLSSSYGGVDLGNYAITGQATTSASISAKALGVSGITASDKVYDGGVSAAVSSAAASLSGLVGGDDVNVAATGVFINKNAGIGKTVTLSSTYGGADLANYAITAQASATAGISARTLNVSGVTASAKVYDGTTAAVVQTAAASLNGLVLGDDVSLTASGVFASKNVGTRNVALALAHSGVDAGNYLLAGQSAASAVITPATLHYVATPISLLTGAAPLGLSGTVDGFVAGESLAGATTGSPAWSTLANAASQPGAYAITGSGLGASNYVFAQAAGNATALTLGTVQPIVSATVTSDLAASLLAPHVGVQLDPPTLTRGNPQPNVTSIGSKGSSLRIVSGGIRLPDGLAAQNDENE